MRHSAVLTPAGRAIRLHTSPHSGAASCARGSLSPRVYDAPPAEHHSPRRMHFSHVLAALKFTFPDLLEEIYKLRTDLCCSRHSAGVSGCVLGVFSVHSTRILVCSCDRETRDGLGNLMQLHIKRAGMEQHPRIQGRCRQGPSQGGASQGRGSTGEGVHRGGGPQGRGSTGEGVNWVNW